MDEFEHTAHVPGRAGDDIPDPGDLDDVDDLVDEVEWKKAKKPRFGWLLIACLFTWLVCGVLTWYASNHLDDCCDLSFLNRIFK